MDATKKRKIISSSLREGYSNASTIRFLKEVLEEDIPNRWKDLLTSAGMQRIVHLFQFLVVLCMIACHLLTACDMNIIFISAKCYKPYLETGIPPLTCARLSYIKMEKATIWLCQKCRCCHKKNEGACGNMLRVGRRRQACGADLKYSVLYPYRPISTWMVDNITRYGAQNLIRL